MFTIKETIEYEETINKSKFIAILTPVHNKEDIEKSLKEVKEKYKGATHYCYAYIIDQEQRCSDDGEPNKTAGMPILTVLEGNKLNHIICIIVRYFGGIKLGTGGLVRAYSSTTKGVIENANIIPYIIMKKIKITFPYDNIKIIDYILTNIEIKEKDYQEKITYQFEIPKENTKNIETKLKSYIESFEIKK